MRSPPARGAWIATSERTCVNQGLPDGVASREGGVDRNQSSPDVGHMVGFDPCRLPRGGRGSQRERDEGRVGHC